MSLKILKPYTSLKSQNLFTGEISLLIVIKSNMQIRFVDKANLEKHYFDN